MPKAIIIGGGFGGMAAALRMRYKGYDVTLIDKQDKLGGRAYAYEKQTEHGIFKHDAGPTVITAKFLFDELFELFGKKREDYVEFRDIYPWYRIVFAGGSPRRTRRDTEKEITDSDSSVPLSDLRGEPLPRFDYGGTIEQFADQIRKFGGEADVEGFRKYLAHSKKIFDVGFTKLGDQPFDKFTTMLKCAPDLVRLGCYRTVWQMGKKYIRNENLRRVFSFQPLLVGGNPFNTTSIYSLIFYLERQWGVQFAMGGTGAIVAGLQKLMEEEGIEIRLGEEIEKIFVEWDTGMGGHLGAHGVELGSGERVLCDRYVGKIICNGDPPHVYRNLLHDFDRGEKFDEWNDGGPLKSSKWTDAKIDALKYSMGLFVLYFGTTRQYPDVAHHTIVLGDSYRELLERLFDKKQLEREDLSVYLHRPTATDPSMAPTGMDSFYVLVPVPNLQPVRRRGTTVRECDERSSCPPRDRAADIGSADHAPSRSRLVADVPVTPDGTIDWDAFGDTFRDDVIRYLERTVLPGLSDCITGDFYVTPNHFRDNLNTHFGTGFSIQPIFNQSAWFRFHNKSEDIDGLYFVGAGTHPGAGMPGVLCSAKVLDRLIPPVNA